MNCISVWRVTQQSTVLVAVTVLLSCTQQVTKGPTKDPQCSESEFLSYPISETTQPNISLIDAPSDSLESRLKAVLRELGYRTVASRKVVGGFQLRTAFVYQVNDCWNEPYVIKIALLLAVGTMPDPQLGIRYCLCWAGCKESKWKCKPSKTEIQTFRDNFFNRLDVALSHLKG